MTYLHEAEPHYLHQTLGLWWVRKGDINPALDGPFMDRADAIEQTDEPRRVLIDHGPR
jgi:hypothetical protein